MADVADAPSLRYQTLRRLAVGGMGEIFLARERGRMGFSRLVVIKRMLPELARKPGFVDMFVDEARIVGHLSHPNICQILELGEEGGVPFLALEYVRGESLAGIWDRAHSIGTAMPLEVTLRILADTAWALHFAHECCDADGQPLNVIHRDISPHNVMVSFGGDVKLMDFGIARADNRMHRTDTGKVKGKVSYMSPEQLRGQSLDRRSDVFAVGVMLWELTLSQRLFGGGSEVETLQRAAACVVPPPRSIDQTYPEELEAIVMRALAADRENRTATAGELAHGLQAQLAKLGGAERVEVAAAMKRLFPTESSAPDDAEPTSSWNSADADPYALLSTTPKPADVDPRPTLPMRTPGEDAQPMLSSRTPTASLSSRTPSQDAQPMRSSRTPSEEARPTLPMRTPAEDERPTLAVRTASSSQDARPTLAMRTASSSQDARPTLAMRTSSNARDEQLPAPAAVYPQATPRRGRGLAAAIAIVILGGAAAAIVIAARERGSSPASSEGATAQTVASATEPAPAAPVTPDAAERGSSVAPESITQPTVAEVSPPPVPSPSIPPPPGPQPTRTTRRDPRPNHATSRAKPATPSPSAKAGSATQAIADTPPPRPTLPKVEPVPAAIPQVGTLAVASDQTGIVSIDGVRAKSTPYQTQLAAGDHRIEVELAEGAGTVRASARIVAGMKTKCRVEKGVLACVASPR